MSEKLCLQWNDFQDNVKSAFGSLRESTDFVDVTLACEDGCQIEAHKVILAASSPFFQEILKKNKHSHPMIYMRGMKSSDLLSIVDFLYYGEANVYQESLDTFLAIAEELQLKGLQCSKDVSGLKERERGIWKSPQPKQIEKSPLKSTTKLENIERHTANKTETNALVIPTTGTGLITSQLTEIVKSMMEPSQNIVQAGQIQQHAVLCKVCGKEGYRGDIVKHIEANHLEISIPCNNCDKVFTSRRNMNRHMLRHHAHTKGQVVPPKRRRIFGKFSSGGRGGVFFNPKIQIEDFGPLNRTFSK